MKLMLRKLHILIAFIKCKFRLQFSDLRSSHSDSIVSTKMTEVKSDESLELSDLLSFNHSIYHKKLVSLKIKKLVLISLLLFSARKVFKIIFILMVVSSLWIGQMKVRKFTFNKSYKYRSLSEHENHHSEAIFIILYYIYYNFFTVKKKKSTEYTKLQDGIHEQIRSKMAIFSLKHRLKTYLKKKPL